MWTGSPLSFDEKRVICAAGQGRGFIEAPLL